jgi:hypothetical protein
MHTTKGEHMTLDEGCAERGCPMHDERETKGVAFIRKEWVGLTEEEINACDPSEEFWGLHKIARAIEQRLKEKNA